MTIVCAQRESSRIDREHLAIGALSIGIITSAISLSHSQNEGISAMDGFEVVEWSRTEIKVCHIESECIFNLAVKDGALKQNPGLLEPLPPQCAMHLSGARRTAIAFLAKRRQIGDV
jgi:hypothetical protein